MSKYRVAYQPILNINNEQSLGDEALLRSDIPPSVLFSSKDPKTIIHLDRISRQLGFKVFLKESYFEHLLFFNCHPITILEDVQLHRDIEAFPFPHKLVIEITEQAADPKKVAQRANYLKKEYGVRVAIDDFGKGYSTNYFSKLIPDYIKLDYSLTSLITNNRKVRTLVKELVKLSDTTGSKVIAEGIETMEQKNILQQCRVNYGQGFLLGKPLIMD